MEASRRAGTSAPVRGRRLELSSLELSAARVRAIRRGVLAGAPALWRDLPWRHTNDPWLVLVSEVMLQQTQVSRVVDPYCAFVVRFPTPAACAEAPLADVVRAWEGLGYNRRAVNLHRAAAAVSDRHEGVVPADLPSLLALPGVGSYTARAILAFAHGFPVGVVDTNVARVLARAVVGRRLSSAEAQATADRLVPADDAWRFNQALFDLGAQVCTSRSPHCAVCPLQPQCRFASAATAVPDPAVGSAGTSGRQSRFAGSDRQGRGRLVDELRTGAVARRDLARAAGWPADPDRAERVAATLVADGLAVWRGNALTLP